MRHLKKLCKLNKGNKKGQFQFTLGAQRLGSFMDSLSAIYFYAYAEEYNGQNGKNNYMYNPSHAFGYAFDDHVFYVWSN